MRAPAHQLSLFASSAARVVAPPSRRAPHPYAVPIYTVTLVRERQILWPRSQLRQAADAAALLRQYLQGVDREHFVIVLLDRKHHIIGMNTVAVGSLTAATVHPREVFKPAIVGNAAALLCAHNHPSGDPQPSADDRVLTTRLHVIVGDGTATYYSFADTGAL